MIRSPEAIYQSFHRVARPVGEEHRFFRRGIHQIGLPVTDGEHPIMLGAAKVAQEIVAKLLTKGIDVIGFSYPDVPQGKARIRTQISAGHSKEDLDKAIAAFAAAHREMTGKS